MLAQWELVERDLADAGIDVGDDALMTGRSWRWLQARVIGLLDRPPAYTETGIPLYTTRLARHFYQQEAFAAAAPAHRSNK